jgi:hypothetical protein
LRLPREAAEGARVEDAIAISGELAPRVTTATTLGDLPGKREGIVRQVRLR